MNFNVSSTGSSFLLTIMEHGLGEQETRTSFLASGLRKTTVVDSSRGWFFFNISNISLIFSNISTLQMPQICCFFFLIFNIIFSTLNIFLSTKENILLMKSYYGPFKKL